jgi:hypothetical protein
MIVIARSESDEAIHASLLLNGLLRFARNDDDIYAFAKSRSPDAAQRVAPLRRDALLIRDPSVWVGPGSAERHHSASKTRVNALYGAAPRPGHEAYYALAARSRDVASRIIGR